MEHLTPEQHGLCIRQNKNILRWNLYLSPHILTFVRILYAMNYMTPFLYPPLESVPRRLAILRRNKWMAEQCDILVAFLERRTGGAYQTFQWAEKRQKTIIQYPNNPFTV